MADHYVCLPDLSAEAMLALLASAVMAPDTHPNKAELLNTCRIVVGAANHALYLQGCGGPLKGECEQFQRKLIDLYSRGKAQQVAETNAISGNGQAVGLAACVLLSLCRGDQQPDPQRFLLVGPGLAAQRITAIFNLLQATASAVSVALVSVRSRGADARSYALFDIRADQARYAAVSSLVAGAAFADCRLLSCFGNGAGNIFLAPPSTSENGGQPAAFGLNPRSLDNFLNLVRYSPATFNLPTSEAAVKDGRLLAIVVEPGGGPAILPLAGQNFGQPVRALNPAEAVAHLVELVADDEAMRRLQTALNHEPPQAGYRLTLQPNRRRRLGDEQHIHKLRAQMEKLAQDLAYHWNMGLVRPRLWRFAPSQLPAMIDALCSFPRQDLQSQRILYGYAATRRHAGGRDRLDYAIAPDSAEGAHYLYIAPDAYMANGNPLAYWEDSLAQLNPTIRYWLDPFWARTYHPANQALIFVPEGTVLSPPIHSAEIEDMDSYLRRTVPRWFPGAFPNDMIAARRPIYLFDGYTSGQHPILVTVLDLADFRPITADIGWLNDNLLLLETLDVRQLITQMADDGARARLAQAVQGQRDQAHANLHVVSAALANELAAKSAELTRVLTEELQSLLHASEKTVADIQSLDHQLDTYRAVYAQMQGLHREAETLLNSLLAAETQLDQRIHDLAGSVKRSVDAAEQTRGRLEREVEQEVRQIELTYERLTDRINRLT